MDAATVIAISTLIDTGIKLWASNAGKGDDWVPTQQDIQDLLSQIDKDTPEAIKAEARERLGN